MFSKISVLEYEEQDQHDLDIQIIPQDDLDTDPSPIPNQNPKWAEKIIEENGNVVGDPDDIRRTCCTLTQLHYLHSGAANFQRDAT